MIQCRSVSHRVEHEQQGDETSDHDAGRSETGASLSPFLDLTVGDESSENGEHRYNGHQRDHQGGDGQLIHRTGRPRQAGQLRDRDAERAHRQVGS